MKLNFQIPLPKALLENVESKHRFSNERILDEMDAKSNVEGHIALAHVHINEASYGMLRTKATINGQYGCDHRWL